MGSFRPPSLDGTAQYTHATSRKAARYEGSSLPDGSSPQLSSAQLSPAQPTATAPRPAPTPPPLHPRGGAEQAPSALRTRSAAPGRAVPGGAELRGAAQIPGQLLADLDLVAERGVAERAVHQHLEGLAELEVVLVEAHVLLGVLLPRDLHGGAAGSRAEGRDVPGSRPELPGL